MTRWLTGIWLILIVAAYLILGYRYATETPAWQVPDEPAHYNYIRQVAEDRRLPVIEPGDWNTDYQNLLTSTGFHPEHLANLDQIEYEDHQPPLYYLLAAPIYNLTDGDLTVMRMFSVFLGLGVVLGIFAVVYRVFPAQPWLALATAAFTAFLPQNLSMISGVNNDVLAQLIVALTFLATVHYLKNPSWQLACGMGVLVGSAFLTKSTVYFLAGIGGISILLVRPLRWQHLAAYLLPALLLGSIWWGHSLDVYGGTDFLGLQRHDEVAAGQLQTRDYIYGASQLNGDVGQYWKNFAYTTFHSFWGQFGWMGVPMPTRLYRILLLISVILGVSCAVYLWMQRPRFTDLQRKMLLLFALQLCFVIAAYFLYNIQFVQFQGRYLYPALLPFGLIAALGLSAWTNLLPERYPLLRWLPVLAMFALAGLAWYALGTYLIPNLPNWN